MKLAEWTMAIGIVFSVGLFLITVFADDPWNDHNYDGVPPIVAGAASPHNDARRKMVCSSCHKILPENSIGQSAGIPPIVKGSSAPHEDGRENQLCANCHQTVSIPELAKWYQQNRPQLAVATTRQATSFPAAFSPNSSQVAPVATIDPEIHERMLVKRFQGVITETVGNKWQSATLNVKIMVYDGVNSPTWLSLAPQPYLESNGCSVGRGMFVKGTVFTDPVMAYPSVRYGKSISVNGAFCNLRDSHMVGYWEPGVDLHHQDK